MLSNAVSCDSTANVQELDSQGDPLCTFAGNTNAEQCLAAYQSGIFTYPFCIGNNWYAAPSARALATYTFFLKREWSSHV